MKRIIAALIIILALFSSAAAEREAWVLCTPGSTVNVRRSPSRHSDSIAMMEVGDHVPLTGKKIGRWYECDVPCEYGIGWIRGDYLVFDRPVVHHSKMKYVTTHGNVFARFSIKGRKSAKLKKGTTVKVLVSSEEWCVTTRGFIMTKYLEAAE